MAECLRPLGGLKPGCVVAPASHRPVWLQLRACKSVAQEAEVASSVLARLRANSKATPFSHDDLLDAIHLHILGYDVQFCVVAVLQLISSPRTKTKMFGLLAASLLCNDNDHGGVLLLTTSSVLHLLLSRDHWEQALALNFVANKGTRPMAEYLVQEIARIYCNTTDQALLCKAALALVRIVRISPGLLDLVGSDRLLLDVRLCSCQEGQVITSLALLDAICDARPEEIPRFRKCIPVLLSHVRTSLPGGQRKLNTLLVCKAIGLLAKLGAGHARAVADICDALLQVLNHPVPHAVVLECVRAGVALGLTRHHDAFGKGLLCLANAYPSVYFHTLQQADDPWLADASRFYLHSVFWNSQHASLRAAAFAALVLHGMVPEDCSSQHVASLLATANASSAIPVACAFAAKEWPEPWEVEILLQLHGKFLGEEKQQIGEQLRAIVRRAPCHRVVVAKRILPLVMAADHHWLETPVLVSVVALLGECAEGIVHARNGPSVPQVVEALEGLQQGSQSAQLRGACKVALDALRGHAQAQCDASSEGSFVESEVLGPVVAKAVGPALDLNELFGPLAEPDAQQSPVMQPDHAPTCAEPLAIGHSARLQCSPPPWSWPAPRHNAAW